MSLYLRLGSASPDSGSGTLALQKLELLPTSLSHTYVPILGLRDLIALLNLTRSHHLS